jgi:hypothetical protein
MFRCHFTKSMRIVRGVNLTAQTLDEAIAEGQRLLGAKPDVDELDGILIWKDPWFHYMSPAPEQPSPGAAAGASAAP